MLYVSHVYDRSHVSEISVAIMSASAAGPQEPAAGFYRRKASGL